MRIFFNSSLPRSGSTLLQNVLAQNPRFYCSPTSGLLELLYAARANFTALNEFKLQDAATMKRAWLGFCRGGLEGYYSGLTEQPVCVDKSRGWMAYYSWLKTFYPNPKIIVCVRDLRAIVSSMEKLYHRNAHLHEGAEQPDKMEFVTVEQRVQHWMTNPPVGLSLGRLADAINQGHAKQFFFVVYEEWVRQPQEVINRLYAYLDEPPFTHNFHHIEQKVEENDALHGRMGDHKVHADFGPRPEDWNETLGPQLSAALVSRNRWFYDRFYPQPQ